MQTQHATTEARATKVPERRKLKVTGQEEKYFEAHEWRLAIKHFLAQIWTKRFCPQESVSLEFPTWAPTHGEESFVMLRYLAIKGRFEAFGSYDQSLPLSLYHHVRKESVLTVVVERPELLEVALARFAWDQQTRVLGIQFRQPSFGITRGMNHLWLWAARGFLTVYDEPRDNDQIWTCIR